MKGATELEDKEFSRLAMLYHIATYISGLYPSKLSTLELRVGLVADFVEATVHVKVTGGSWPVGFKGMVHVKVTGGSWPCRPDCPKHDRKTSELVMW
jgi:membrane protein implicated in regulation of membrane protease activity